MLEVCSLLKVRHNFFAWST